MIHPGAPGSRVTRLELLYDLIFVFAFLNVTNVAGEQLTPLGLTRALLVLALLWWCWTSFAALGNLARADQGLLPLLSFGIMAAVLVLALTLPEAFVDDPGGLYGPVVFAACYAVVRVGQLAVHWTVLRTTGAGWVGPMRNFGVFAVPVVTSTVLILTAALIPHSSDEAEPNPLRLGLWAAAILVEYLAGTVRLSGRFYIVSAGHWAERHALIVLVALGESIISIGVGPNLTGGLPVTWAVIVAAILGFTVTVCLWWMYFDEHAIAAEQSLHGTREPEVRRRLVRDAYTYLHLPMIIGIIGFALGLKRYLGDISADPETGWQHRVGALELDLLYGGVLLFLLALAAFARRTTHHYRPALPLVVLVVVLILVIAAIRPPALIALAMLAIGCVVLVLMQFWQRAHARSRVRRTALDEQLASEVDQSEWRRKHL
ncbi:low temperature requirement protein A [Polymorphospora rubra]|uniref:low temperature requirement protein A n=1 Tax=Polymorphospora rubra TaxID=338584 RepID=UPI0033C8A6C6